MDKNRRDSELSNDLYLSLYGSNRKLKPERIKTYALFKKLAETTKSIDNFVIASDDTNEISVSFNKRSDSKVITFDRVFYNDVSKNENLYCITRCAVQDVIMGLNSFIVLCKLAFPHISSFDDKTSIFDMECISNLVEKILKELLLYTQNEGKMDSSLHASYFEVHDEKIIDLLKNCYESKDAKIFEIPDQNCIEIEDLVEKSIVDERDILELLSKQQSHSFMCHAYCCCSVLSVSLIKKNVNSDGFEFIKVGKFIMVGFTKCNSNFLMDGSKNFEDLLLKFIENQEIQSSPKYKIFDILRSAFGGHAKTSIVVTLSSVLYSLEKDLNILQFVSEVQKIFNHPEIDLKLIVPNSLKEYSEEIQELQKDFNTFSKGAGIMLDSLLYRSYKNSISLEGEKIKTLSNRLLLLTDAINSKKQNLISCHVTAEATECEIKDLEKSIESLKLDSDKIKNENVKQKVSMKADEILAVKQVKISNELFMKKLKSDLSKTYRDYEELSKSLHCLKNDVVSLSCDMVAEQTSLRSTLELLMVDINNTLSDFHNLQGDLLRKLDNFTEIDALLIMWKQNTENLLSKFSYFIDEIGKKFNHIKVQMSSSLIPLHTSQSEMLEIIRKNRNEKWPVLSYYFHKVQIFCDSSFKILSEVICQLDMIQSCYKAELKAIGVVLCSSSKAFKKFVNDTSTALKSYQQYFEDQERELSEVTDIVCFHHKFKKHFDENIGGIKSSLFNLKQMCLDHNDATISKWNEIQKNCCKTSEKHGDLTEHLSMIHKETSKYADNLAQQKMNALEYSPMKDKTENIESRLHQLLEIHKEMVTVIGEAFEVHGKGTDKELLEVKDFINSQKAVIEKYFETSLLKLKTSSRSFYDELRIIRQTFASSKEEMKKTLDSLSSCISDLATICNKYWSVSNFVLEKSERSFKILPTIREDRKDNLPDLSYLILDEWKVATSTPSVSEKKTLNLSHEKEKLLSRMKSVVEQQMSQKLDICDLDSDGKERKNPNISTMSLPNLNTHSKAYNTLGRNFSRLKLQKKSA